MGRAIRCGDASARQRAPRTFVERDGLLEPPRDDADAAIPDAAGDVGFRDAPGPSGEATLEGEPPALPGPDDFHALERAVGAWALETGALSAALHRLEGGITARLCRVGPEDPLLDALVELAGREDAPQVVTADQGRAQGRGIGAWLFRAGTIRGVLAAAAFDPATGAGVWASAARALSVAWSHPSGEPSRARARLLGREAFGERVVAAIERRTTGVRCELHRLAFAGAGMPLEPMLDAVAARMRASDALCLVAPRELLVLCGGAGCFGALFARIVAHWQDAWSRAGREGSPPEPTDELLALEDAADVQALVAARESREPRVGS